MILKGKIAAWFWLLLAGVNIALLYGFFTEDLSGGDGMALLFTFVGINMIFIPMVIKNYVEIDGDKLIFVLGFCRDSMKIEDITEVYKTHNPIAAGALSLDRIVIKGRRKEWMISVCDKEKLFHELKRRNPVIQIRR